MSCCLRISKVCTLLGAAGLTIIKRWHTYSAKHKSLPCTCLPVTNQHSNACLLSHSFLDKSVEIYQNPVSYSTCELSVAWYEDSDTSDMPHLKTKVLSPLYLTLQMSLGGGQGVTHVTSTSSTLHDSYLTLTKKISSFDKLRFRH